MAQFDRHSRFVGELLQGPSPESRSGAVAAPAVGCNQQAPRSRISFLSQTFPPASDGGDRKLGRVMTDAHGDAGFVVREVVDAIGHRLAERFVRKVMSRHFLGVALL